MLKLLVRREAAADRARVLVHVAVDEAGLSSFDWSGCAASGGGTRVSAPALAAFRREARQRGLPEGPRGRPPLRGVTTRAAPCTGLRTMCLAILAALAFAACGERRRPASAAPDRHAGLLRRVEPGTAPALPAPRTPASGSGTAWSAPGAAHRHRNARHSGAAAPCGSPTWTASRRSLTEDFSPPRINVRVRDGVIAGVEFMG